MHWGHSKRVAAFCKDILHELAMHGPDAELIVSVARVHDIGKIAIPDSVLNKTDELTADEFAIMARHAEVGADLLLRYPDFGKGASIVRYHHERWDGAGYPHKLSGLDIPFGARVIAVADGYDAMTSDRPYRAGLTEHHAVHILCAGRGSQWDPDVVNAFLEVLERRRVAAGAWLATPRVRSVAAAMPADVVAVT